ncbi:MAG: BREX-2 system adenine-specific DNA-methyltransferase PglX [Pseudonocardiaceae bacterium]
MIDRKALLADLRTEVIRLEADLREQVETVDGLAQRMQAEHTAATKARRTAATWTSWRDEQVTQAAVAWVLGTVFVRWCEDNELIDPVLSGPGDRLGAAEDVQLAYFRTDPHRTDADWLRSAFEVLAASDAGAMLFDKRHNPAFLIPVSHDGAKGLIAFWRTRRGDGSLVHDFDDPSWDTRFLGDLYQNLSEDAKTRFALLQTPEFVEEFILDLTLTPAIEEFGLDGLRVIDPTCGSGHFLLGTFHRLVAAWREQAPSLEPYELARSALDSVHGVDLNPFAVAIARFRLLVDAWRVAGVRTVAEGACQVWRTVIAVGDPLLPLERQHALEGMEEGLDYWPPWDDTAEFDNEHLLEPGSYHVVVGNPPYITVDDSNLSARYRVRFSACHRQYQLTVPFAELFFDLARRASNDGRGAGHVGEITSNAFMKREFGTKLIGEFFRTVALTHVIDTSGAYIPGHGTPTVILIGERRRAAPDTPVRAVLGIRGEPSQPTDPAKGVVWAEIADHVNAPGYESEWITVTDLPRSRFESHPWSLSGGGADDLLIALDSTGGPALGSYLDMKIGFASFPAADDVFFVDPATPRRKGIDPALVRPLVLGDMVRDWEERTGDVAVVPYGNSQQKLVSMNLNETWGRFLWPNRRVLQSITGFGGQTRFDSGEPWWAWYRWVAERYRMPLSIAFAEVATHNHFVLDRGGKAFKQTAPVIKMPEEATEEEHLALLGVLNSSTACFWLKQNCFNKGNGGIGGGIGDEGWEPRYQFAGTRVELYPLPQALPAGRARRLDRLASELAAVSPFAVHERATPTSEVLAIARAEWVRLWGRMVAEQEELDWDVYHRYGLISNAEAAEGVLDNPAEAPELALGERAFEIVLARRMAEGKTDTQWFARHGSTPIIELPGHWSEQYRQVVERRIEMIERRRDLALIERPECKRRWNTEPWEKQQERALREWLLDRLEVRNLWFALDANGDQQPTMRSVHSLADALRRDNDFTGVAALWAPDALGRPDVDLAEIVGALIDAEHVPFLAAYRYKGKGFEKRADWEHVWDLQRAEDQIADRTGHDIIHPEVRHAVERELGTIPVPPKYGSGDFARAEYWRHRGKLDVPKERFISYPAATRDGDGSLLLGWAGWDHREQAQALAVLATVRRSEDGWSRDWVTPLLAGLAELLPWVAQWHGEFDPAFGGSPAELYEGFFDAQLAELDLSRADLTTWRPTGRVDVAPLPRKNASRTLTPATTRTRRPSTEPDPEQLSAVLDAAASGPLSNEQIRALTGLDTAGARAVAKHLVTRGELVTTGQKRGTLYQLP